jgi:hypothetical protein
MCFALGVWLAACFRDNGKRKNAALGRFRKLMKNVERREVDFKECWWEFEWEETATSPQHSSIFPCLLCMSHHPHHKFLTFPFAPEQLTISQRNVNHVPHQLAVTPLSVVRVSKPETATQCRHLDRRRDSRQISRNSNRYRRQLSHQLHRSHRHRRSIRRRI